MGCQAVIFDMDGTLVDSLGAISACMNMALESLGYPPHPREDYREGIGNGMRALILHLMRGRNLSEQELSRIMEVYLPIYAGPEAMKRTVPYDGIMPLLHALKDCGVKTAVLTNKDDYVAGRVVRDVLGGFAFGAVRGFIDGRPNKPDHRAALEVAGALGVSPEKALFVGDSDVDMLTAVRAGMVPVGVSWGYRSREELTRSGARYIVEDPKQLLSIVKDV